MLNLVRINQRGRSVPRNAGQSLVEYLILTALLAISTMAIIRVMGHSVAAKFAQVTKVIQGRPEGSVQIERVEDTQYRKKDMSDFMSGAARGNGRRGGSGDGN